MKKLKELYQKDKKSFLLSTIAILIVLVFVIGATYAYFIAQIGDDQRANITGATETVDSLIFRTGDAITIAADMYNFAQNKGNQEGETYAKASLMANTGNNSATYNYYLYLNIEENEFHYTTQNNTPELILQVTAPNGVTWSGINGMSTTTVTDGKGVAITGYDITELTGLLTIASPATITSTTTNEYTEQEWDVKIVLVNLDEDQTANTEKNILSTLRLKVNLVGGGQ